MFGTTLQRPVAATKQPLRNLRYWQLCFCHFRRLALHLQPMAEPTPVETVAPPSEPPSAILKPEIRLRSERVSRTCAAQQLLAPRNQNYFILYSRSISLF